jgi:signal transduction histidine kinase
MPSSLKAGIGLNIRHRLMITFFALAICLLLIPTILLERQARRSLEGEMEVRLEGVAAAATTQIDPSLIAAALSLPSETGSRTRARLSERLDQLKTVTGVRRIYLLDRDGRDQLDTDSAAVTGVELPQARAHRAMLQAAAEGGPASSPLFRDARGETRKTAYAPLIVKGEVLGYVGVEADARFLRELGALRRRLILIGILGLALSAVLSFGLARGLTRPLGDLVTAARAMGSGNLDRPIPQLGGDEVGFLARTLEESRASLAERDRTQRAMVAGIAHEIRNPLGGIQIYVELLENDPSLSLTQRERVSKILREIHRLGGIIEEFLAYARPQNPVRAGFDPRGIIGETFDLMSGLALSREVRLVALPPAGTIIALADPGQIRQALLNLVRNAIEASPAMGEVTIGWDRQDGRVRISVTDHGAGIAPADRERVFEPFFSTKAEGAGLGLSIVRHMVGQNGGSILLESADGGGSRFLILLDSV